MQIKIDSILYSEFNYISRKKYDNYKYYHCVNHYRGLKKDIKQILDIILVYRPLNRIVLIGYVYNSNNLGITYKEIYYKTEIIDYLKDRNKVNKNIKTFIKIMKSYGG